jgi:hypothetical protein
VREVTCGVDKNIFISTVPAFQNAQFRRNSVDPIAQGLIPQTSKDEHLWIQFLSVTWSGFEYKYTYHVSETFLNHPEFDSTHLMHQAVIIWCHDGK